LREVDVAIQITVPELGESVLEATVHQWLKKEGEPVEAGEALVELETDKVNLEVGAKTSGVLSRIAVPEGQDVKVGDVLGLIDEKAAESAPTAPKAKAPPAEVQPAPNGHSESTEKPEVQQQKTPQITPVASRLAREQNVDLSRVHGSGPEGRVIKSDVEQYLQEQRTVSQPAAGAGAPHLEPRPSEPREERQRMSRRRRTIAQRLLEASQSTAMLTTFNEVDMSAVMDLRRRRNETFQQRYGVKLGITSFFVRASISALKSFPRLNAELQGDEIVLKHFYDIGVAVGAEEGLVVPVLRDADRLSFPEIERRIKDLAIATENGTLSVEDLRGGTFTITNGGVFGSLLSTPILSLPQVGILGLHKIEDRPVARNAEIVIRPMMYVALSYDHRIVDGREAVQFLVHVKDLIEDPEAMLLEG
jgi:2-oxoglutarate dehydrogenase E2 component (dihydrolipoamide succinyltransferase)